MQVQQHDIAFITILEFIKNTWYLRIRDDMYVIFTEVVD